MRKTKFIFLGFVFTILVFVFLPSFSSAEQNYICSVYFTGVGCPHCANTDPIVLKELPSEYPNFIVIEYEIYQQRENASLIYGYNENYNSGLGIPLIIFNKEEYIVGDRPILNNVREIIEKSDFNKCSLVNGASSDFNNLDIVSLPGFPKIWAKDKILLKTGPGGDGELLKKLIETKDLSQTLKGAEFDKITPLKIALSGKYVEFDNAIKTGNWIFQWNGKGLDTSVASLPSEEIPPEETPAEEPVESASKLTLPKVVSLAAIDAVNPCALAVLTIMLIAILTYNPTKKRNILLAGLAFITSVFIMYLAYGFIIIKAFQLIQTITFVRLWLYKILGAGAIVLGCFKLKDFFQYKAVCKTSSRVEKIVSKVTSPGGAFLVGAFVTIFLLPCTIGPYIICGGILSSIGMLKSLPWLLLYNLIFVLPMLIVVFIVYLGMRRIKDVSTWEAKNIKYLNLIAGIIILGLGIAMVLGLV
jgi:cytochrome c biogenesis protein CcdA